MKNVNIDNPISSVKYYSIAIWQRFVNFILHYIASCVGGESQIAIFFCVRLQSKVAVSEYAVCSWADVGEMAVDGESTHRRGGGEEPMVRRPRTSRRCLYKVVSGEPDWMHGDGGGEREILWSSASSYYPSEGLKLMNDINPYRHRYLYASGDFPYRVHRLCLCFVRFMAGTRWKQ